MPESRRRKKQNYTPPANASGTPKPVRIGSPRWLAPTMLTMFVVGLLWIVAWYIAGTTIPVMRDLGWVNLLVGFGFIGVGFALATRWE